MSNMKIDSSTIQMDAGRVYTQSTGYSQTVDAQNEMGDTFHSSTRFVQEFAMYTGTSASNNALSDYDHFDQQAKEGTQSEPLNSGLYNNLGGLNVKLLDVQSALEEFRQQLIKQLEEFMERIRNQLWGHYCDQNNNISSNTPSMARSVSTLGAEETAILDLTTNGNSIGSRWTIQTQNTSWYAESETTVFDGKGTVKTADGRSIEFEVSMEMSRSFMEESTELTEQTRYLLTDPLVIQLKDAPDTIAKETWYFDIDGDGIKDNISQLANGNGFLALDANDNGIIDDGTELFGAKTGNGFKELAAYDEDHNGFIDENDSVYSRLKVWTKDENGEDKLMDLQGADIGAIYLGYADTQFSHNDLATNETKAMVRNTGFFLHESTGQAGIIQQVDFVKQAI